MGGREPIPPAREDDDGTRILCPAPVASLEGGWALSLARPCQVNCCRPRRGSLSMPRTQRRFLLIASSPGTAMKARERSGLHSKARRLAEPRASPPPTLLRLPLMFSMLPLHEYRCAGVKGSLVSAVLLLRGTREGPGKYSCVLACRLVCTNQALRVGRFKNAAESNSQGREVEEMPIPRQVHKTRVLNSSPSAAIVVVLSSEVIERTGYSAKVNVAASADQPREKPENKPCPSIQLKSMQLIWAGGYS